MKREGALADLGSWQPNRCSLALAMDVIGTKSAFLLLREAFYGTTRFDDFVRRVGITEPVAAARLKDLVEAGILDKQPYREPGQRTRSEYVLTEKGTALFPALLALIQWGDEYLQPDGGPIEFVADDTGDRVHADVRTPEGAAVAVDNLRLRRR
ncbi:helix-turn-helix domain-containing protein [Kutzneria sp. 744]|uniref:winged helix-turn-helix transcriptional regulator n=1 Tax=Kutzneria sp. (strain 744) TaxID=345341 RepID=UPI0003EED665|nr:helix-turn-helix domain-containing protein [Kutzneria sp. 744]EWM18462.1 transcriptional regulator [Kutzneria sp. 744]